MESIRKGLISIIPAPLLNSCSAKDLEVLVCGKADVDFELLKRHTKYAGGLNESS